MRKLRISVSVLLVAAGLTGCATNKLIRYHVPAAASEVKCPIRVEGPLDRPEKVNGRLAADSDPACAATSIESNEPFYRLAFVEFDDQGRLRKDRQFQALENLLHTEAKNTGRPGDPYGGLTILVFVHGWRHNVAGDDANVTFAREVLWKTFWVEQQRPQYTPNDKPRRVVGIYVGWRGKSLTSLTKLDALNTIEVATFWDRKSTAERVAVGSVRELFALLNVFRGAENATPSIPEIKERCTPVAGWPEPTNICPKVRLFIVGHSFGGLLVFNAISESLIHSIRNRTDARKVVGEYADLVLLVNPAIEGARFEPLHQAVLRWPFDPRQVPIFISVTARDDRATGWAFPFGRWFSTLFDAERPSSGDSPDPKDRENAEVTGEHEREANRHTMGHIDRYKTHLLTKVANGPDACPKADVPGSACACQGRTLTYAEACEVLGERLAKEYLARDGMRWDARYRDFCGDGKVGVRLWVHKRLEERIGVEASQLYTPIWIVESDDTDIIKGHSDFTGDLFRQYLVQLYHDRVIYGRDDGGPAPEPQGPFCGLRERP